MPLPPQKTSGAREQGANVAVAAAAVVVGSVFVWLVMMKLHRESPTPSSSSAGETLQIVFVRVQQPQSQGDVAHVGSSSVLMRRSAATATSSSTVNDDSGGNPHDTDTETNTENTASGYDADCTSHELIWKSGAVLFVKRTVGSESLSSSSWSWRPPSVGSAMLCFFLVVEAPLTFFEFRFCGANLSILVGKRSEFDIVDTPIVGGGLPILVKWWCRSSSVLLQSTTLQLTTITAH